MEERIVIPDQIYIGYNERKEYMYITKLKKNVEVDSIKLGFATYYENNAAFRKRQSTIDSWARGGAYRQEKSPWEPEILDNKPQSNFKISKMTTHGGGWNDITVHWRIVDPRGFELEISSGNLAKLFQYCNVDEGVISQPCIYGFDKGNQSKVVLLPVNTEIYKQSVKSTELHNAKGVVEKDVPMGSLVKLKNGRTGIYYGKVNTIHLSGEVSNGHSIAAISTPIKVIVEIEDNDPDTRQIYMFSTIKIIEFEPPELSKTEDQYMEDLNHILKSRRLDVAGGNWDMTKTLHFTKKKVNPSEIILKVSDADNDAIIRAYNSFMFNDTKSNEQQWYKNYDKFGLLVIGKNILWNQYFRGYYNVKNAEEKAIRRTIIEIVPFDIVDNVVKPSVKAVPYWYGGPIHTLNTREFSVTLDTLKLVQQIVVEYDGKEFPLVL